MTTFFTSDSHFGHARIIELCNRPFRDVQHMNEELVDRWNSVVSPEDTVYHMGDLALGKFEDSMTYVAQLNGRKILLTGNHDRTFLDPEAMAKNPSKHLAYASRFKIEYGKYFENVSVYTPVRKYQYGAAQGAIMLTNGQKVRLSHFPYTGDSHDKPRFDAIRPVDDGLPLIHGHTHQSTIYSKSAKGTPQVHVGVDSWDYYPVSEAQLMLAISSLPE